MWVWSKLSSAKWRDAWEERLQALAGTSLVITEFAGKASLRVEMYCQHKAVATRIHKQFGGSLRKLKKENWAALATPQIAPIKIRDRFLVVSESDEPALDRHRAAHPDRELLVIPVEMAFGTGDHPTTATCLRLICDLPLDGRRVLDLGCGTGILALAAKKLGAGRVLAVDFDPEAVAASKRNARRNQVRGVTFERRDVLAWSPDEPPFDLILANIFADVLTASFPKMKQLLAAGGTLIISGILDKSAPELLKEGSRTGFTFTQVIQRGKWVTAVAEHAPSPGGDVSAPDGRGGPSATSPRRDASAPYPRFRSSRSSISVPKSRAASSSAPSVTTGSSTNRLSRNDRCLVMCATRVPSVRLTR